MRLDAIELGCCAVIACSFVGACLCWRELKAGERQIERWARAADERERAEIEEEDRMRKLNTVASLLCVVMLAAMGCVPQPNEPTPTGDVIVTQNVNIGQGGSTGAGPGGTGPGTCNPVASLGVALLGTGGVRTADIRIGQSINLDTTPRDAQNQIRPDSCNAATPVLWRLNPTSGICSLNNETTYTPTLTGIGVGRCEAFSQIGSVTASIPVVVNVRQ